MKKLISLLLVLVMTMSLLTGLASALNFEKPDECAQADAVVKVTDKNGDSYYFAEFVPAVIHWARKELPGAKTITMLKDVTLDLANSDHEQRFFELSGDLSDWNGRNGTKNPIIIDLGGNTLTYSGEAALFYATRFGFTLKNGTVDYSSKGRSMIAVGTSTGGTAISSGGESLKNLYQPQINLEDVTIIARNGSCLLNQVWGLKLSVKDSSLIALKGTALNLLATDQSKLASSAKPYTGAFTATVDIENSALVSMKNYAFTTSRDEYQFSVKDTLLVSNGKKETMYNEETAPTIDTRSLEITPVVGWTGEIGGEAASGNAYVIGENPLKVELPFTDVKEGDWFYSFVSELYGKKIIAGQTADTFNPNGNLTYAAAIKLLVVGLTGKDPGNASGAHWATNYLTEATTAGWTAIGADKLDAPITREAFCEIAAKAKNLTEQPAENKFTDTQNTAVLALVKAGVINGMNETTFAPANVLTRAQISKIISLLLKL